MDDEIPPQYVEYPRALIPATPSDDYKEFSNAWSLTLVGIFLSPLVGLFALIPLNKLVRKGYRRAKFIRALQLTITFCSSIWWTLEVFNLWGPARKLFGGDP